MVAREAVKRGARAVVVGVVVVTVLVVTREAD
jgi:hypothetical protein